MGVWRRGFQNVMHKTTKWKILRGDKVMVMAGRDAGQVGTVLQVLRDLKFPRVVVEGLNLNKRHIKRTRDNPGGIVSVESPLHYSNVALVDPVTGGPVRVSWRFLEDGTKVRITRGRAASASIVPRPDVLKQRRKPRNVSAGALDTAIKVAEEETHKPGDLPAFLRQRLVEQAQAPPQPAAAAAQQVRQYHSGAVGSNSSSILGGSSILAAAVRLLGGRVPPLGASGSMWGLWRGFASSAWLGRRPFV